MTEEGAELQYILDAVARLGTEVEQARPGDPELAAVVASVNNLRDSSSASAACWVLSLRTPTASRAPMKRRPPAWRAP